MMVVFAHHSRVELAINLLNDGQLLDRNGAFVNNRAVDDMKVFFLLQKMPFQSLQSPHFALWLSSRRQIQPFNQLNRQFSTRGGGMGMQDKPSSLPMFEGCDDSLQNDKLTFFRHPTQAFTNLRYFGTHLWHPPNTIPQLVSQSSGLGKLTRPESAPQQTFPVLS